MLYQNRIFSKVGLFLIFDRSDFEMTFGEEEDDDITIAYELKYEEFSLQQSQSSEDWGNESETTMEESKTEMREQNQEAKLEISTLSWNSNGSRIGVGFSARMHESLCQHHSTLCIWSIFARDFNSSNPQIKISVPNCLSALEFHPTQANILAGGTFNGEIFLWDLFKEDPYICNSSIDNYFHRETITQLQWTHSTLSSSTTEQVNLLNIQIFRLW